VINGYLEKIDPISNTYLADFSIILKKYVLDLNISLLLNISEQCSENKKLEKSLETAMFRPNPTT